MLLKITGIKFDTYIGVKDFEKLAPALVSVDLEIKYEGIGHETDNIDDTFCYDELSKIVVSTAQKKHYELIEHLSYSIYKELKKKDMIVNVHLTKFAPKCKHFVEKSEFSYGDFLKI